MEIRRVGDAKIRLEIQPGIPVSEKIKQLQASFMETTGNCLPIGEFYVKNIKPLFEQKEPYKNLKQIDTQFAGLMQLLKATKGMDADILEGYCHVLTLYKFFACFQFLQIKLIPRSSQGFGAASPTSPVSPASQTPLTLSILPKPRERKFSTGFTKIQSASAQRHLLVYKENLKKWCETPFSFSAAEWNEKADDLNEGIHIFNQELKDLSSSVREKALSSSAIPAGKSENINENEQESKNVYENSEDKDHIDQGINHSAGTAVSSSTSTSEEEFKVDEIEILFEEERNFLTFSQNLQAMTLKQKQLTEKCSLFEQARDAAILLLEQCDVLSYDELKKADCIPLTFSREELDQIGSTDEIEEIAKFYPGKLERCDKKKSKIKGLEESINTLQRDISLLSIPFSEKNMLGKLLMRNRIFALLRQFKAILELIFSEYKKILQGIQVKLDDYHQELFDNRALQIKAIKRNIMKGVRKKFNNEIKPLQEGAISYRKEKRISYVAELKSQRMVVPMDAVSSLNEIQKKIENQMNSNWETEIKKIIEEYRNNFSGITTNIYEIEDRETIRKKINNLDSLCLDVERRRFKMLSIVNNFHCPRQDKIIKFFVPFDSFMQEIRQVMKFLKIRWIGKKIDSYSEKYNYFITLQVDETIPELQNLLKEIQIFDKVNTENFDEHTTKLLQTLITRIKLWLSYDNTRKKKNREIAQEFQAGMLSKIGSSSSADILQKAKTKVAAWRREEARTVMKDLKDRASLEQRLRRIDYPIRCLQADIENCPTPEYSCFWAIVWSIILPFFGYCIYQWWYDRKCRLAMENHIRARGSGNTSYESSAANSPIAVLRTILPQDKQFTEDIMEDKRQLGSSGKMTRVMRSLHPQPVVHQEMYASRHDESWNKKVATYPLKRSLTNEPYKHHERTRQRLYKLASQEKLVSPEMENHSPDSEEERSPNTSPFGKTFIRVTHQ